MPFHACVLPLRVISYVRVALVYLRAEAIINITIHHPQNTKLQIQRYNHIANLLTD